MRAMILSITSEYHSLPDVRELSIEEIRFFYNGIIEEIIEAQKERRKNGK